MKKDEKLNKWLWKWHFIAGLISLPFIIILSVTGVIYLFKADYEAPRQQHIKEVVVSGESISFQEQWAIANANMPKKPNAMVVSTAENQATQFVSGRFSHKNSLYVNPFNGEVTGAISAKDGLMYKVRKLHGELLMGKFGTKIVELIASWMIVLILTGIYVWWPARGWKLKGFFVPRTKEGKRTFFRDLHSITGFWISILLLMVLGGGFPWTDVVGENFKWVQKVTNTGYPATWQGRGVVSEGEGEAITLDEMIGITKSLELPGEVTISFPKGPQGVYSVSNSTPDLGKQQVVHFNQFTGEKLMEVPWQEVGSLMRGRMWLMAFHQGEFGRWNWFLMIFVGTALFVMSSSALVSFLLRKRKGSWGVPKVPKQFKVGYGIVIAIVLLSIVFPLFGASLLLLLAWEILRNRRAFR
ncbi:PepSY domain-containing protein [Aureisphaera galaxeae]|uniref:PepSY-associated TM helix domain-containing protein n=1 Tax=Aureisphaera galaxeae TaxID=1538023 RepID=UPI002350C574|nr:PepSY domain-containing protein [Aureisphaera galaxeae]MDC8003055.1 PepSY domain-containing protein [Aureisphaera galaxeae]